VAGRPVLDYVLKAVQDCHAIKRTFLLTNQRFEKQLSAFLTSSQNHNVELIVEPAPRPGLGLGAVGALDYMLSPEPRDVVVLGGDNLFGFRLDEFVGFAHRKATTANALYRFETGHEASDYGVATLGTDDTVRKFDEKVRIPAHLNISTACYFLRESEVRLLAPYLRRNGDPNSLGSFIHSLVAQGVPVAGHVFSQPWFDIGTRRKLLEANRHFLVDSKWGVQEGTTKVEGPAQIERQAVLRNSRVGPNVYMGSGVEIRESVVRDSIIMEGAKVLRSKVFQSVVGSNSTVEGWLVDAVVGCGANILTEMPQTKGGDGEPWLDETV